MLQSTTAIRTAQLIDIIQRKNLKELNAYLGFLETVMPTDVQMPIDRLLELRDADGKTFIDHAVISGDLVILQRIITFFSPKYHINHALFNAFVVATTQEMLIYLKSQLEADEARTKDIINLHILDVTKQIINLENIDSLNFFLYQTPFYQQQATGFLLKLFNYAVKQKKFAAALVLLNATEDKELLLNQVNEQGLPLLHECYHDNNLEGSQFLMTQGCDLEQKDAQNKSLVQCIHPKLEQSFSPYYQNDEEKFRWLDLLAEQGAQWDAVIDLDPNYLFHNTIQQRPKIMRAALEAGADILLKANNLVTVLEDAAYSRNDQVLRVLSSYIKKLVIEKEKVKEIVYNKQYTEKQLKQINDTDFILEHCLDIFDRYQNNNNVQRIFREFNLDWISGLQDNPENDQEFFQALLPFLRIQYPERYPTAMPSLVNTCMLYVHQLSTPARQALVSQSTGIPDHLGRNLIIAPDGIYHHYKKDQRAAIANRQAIQAEEAREHRELVLQIGAQQLPLIQARAEELLAILARLERAQQKFEFQHLGITRCGIFMCLGTTLVIMGFLGAQMLGHEEDNGSPYTNVQMAGIILGCGLALCIVLGYTNPCQGYRNRIENPKLCDLKIVQQQELKYLLVRLAEMDIFPGQFEEYDIRNGRIALSEIAGFLNAASQSFAEDQQDYANNRIPDRRNYTAQSFIESRNVRNNDQIHHVVAAEHDVEAAGQGMLLRPLLGSNGSY